MGLFYLLTLYCFARGARSGDLASAEENKFPNPTPFAWLCLSVLSCLLGMATKEVMATAPIIVFLYDRTFVSGSFGEAWRRRRPYYLGLAGTWILLCLLVLSMGGSRGKAAGFGTLLATGSYPLTQCRAVVRYLALGPWPGSLTFDLTVGTCVGAP